MVELHLAVPIMLGIILGILEAFFVYEDENMTSGKNFLGDMWHGVLFSIIGVSIASNVPYFLNFIPQSLRGLLFVDAATGSSFVISILITIIMLIKMVGSHKIKGVSGGGFSEKFWHKLVVAIAVGFSPYYLMLIYPILAPYQKFFPFGF